jgi:hypothetical protein
MIEIVGDFPVVRFRPSGCPPREATRGDTGTTGRTGGNEGGTVAGRNGGNPSFFRHSDLEESASLRQTEERDISIGEAGDGSIGDLQAKAA